jgi:antitoxin VapB
MEQPYRVRITHDAEGQLLRLPKELEVAETELEVIRRGDELVLRPLKQRKTLAEVLAELEPIDEEFPEIDDPPPDPVKI